MNKASKEKVVSYNRRSYLIDPIAVKSGSVNEFHHAKQNVNIFYKKSLNYDGFFCLTHDKDVYDILKSQPTKKQVDKAIIWGTGFANENSIYEIKNGGETTGDYYMSVLRYDAKDSWNSKKINNIPILVKYSTNFDDVLITMDEIEYLFNNTCSKKAKKQVKEDNTMSAISYFLHKAKSDEDKEICINQIIRSNGIDIALNYLRWFDTVPMNKDRFVEKRKELQNILEEKKHEKF